MKIDPNKIIISPVQTEKSLIDRARNKYHFWVNYKANKYQIKQAFEALFKIKPLAVNTTSDRSRTKFSSRTRSYIKTANTKKAIITLSSKDKLDILTVKKQK
jgi:large subunit ribosomal protein L23